MSKIVIKKRVSLDFLGEDYKEAYLTFRTMPLSHYKEFTNKLPKISPEYIDLIEKVDSDIATEEDHKRLVELQEENKDVNNDSYDLILETLKKYFVGGKFPDESGKLQYLTIEDANELDNIDRDTATECFNLLTGEKQDPKVN